MKHTSLLESYSQSQDNSLADKIKRSLSSEISSRSSVKLQARVDLLDVSFAVVSIRQETSVSSDVLLSKFSNKSEFIDQPPLFLGLISSDVTCGAFATVNGSRVCAIGDADGSVTLLSCNKQDTVLAKLDCIGSASRPALKIIQHVYPTDSNVVCLWVAYPDSIEQIACNITEGRVAQFIRTLTLKYNEREFGTFNCFEVSINAADRYNIPLDIPDSATASKPHSSYAFPYIISMTDDGFQIWERFFPSPPLSEDLLRCDCPAQRSLRPPALQKGTAFNSFNIFLEFRLN